MTFCKAAKSAFTTLKGEKSNSTNKTDKSAVGKHLRSSTGASGNAGR
jgi:hypothetical protein